MSTTIENQIVKMQFDNSGFEKGAKESMSTLDKFKKMLHFDKVNMTPLQQAFAETEATATKAGFHIKDIWLKVASTLENQIADKIVNTGKKIFNALTLEGVSDGFKEYELKMGSIQTIMAGTGESLATVNKYLEDLNTYSDKTIYSFSDMTSNIGKFTNAGVKLKDAVAAIKGIANEAAISGANANEASRAMYNFAQALSSGYVKLIDWKSIENANMATKEFKQTLLDVALGLGTVRKVGEQYETTTTNAQGKVSDLFDATKMFNDSLNHQWMTTEVLTHALEIYATDVRELSDTELANYEKRLKEELHLNDDQVKAFERMGMKAADAATEIKTFTMLIDTLKEAIGSGWAMTWQYFIGDFEQAKALWTDVGNVLGGAIDKMSEARNKVVKQALQNGWEKFTTFPNGTIPESEKYRDILVDIAEKKGVLTKKQAVEIKSNKDLMDSFHELKWATGDLLKESIVEYSETLSSMSKEELEAAGITEDMISEFNNFKSAMIALSKNGADPFGEMAESMNELGGRENIIEGLKNIFVSLRDVVKPIGEAFDNVFGVMDPSKIFDLTKRFKDFTEQLKVSDDAANTIRTSFTLAFGGIKAILDAVGTAIKGVLKLVLPVFNLFDAIFGLIGKVVSALTGSDGALEAADKFSAFGDKIGDKYIGLMEKLAEYINRVADAIRGIPDSKIFTKIRDGVSSAIDSVKDFVNSFVDMPVVQQMIEDFNTSIENIQTKLEPVSRFISQTIEDTKKKIKSFFTWESLNKNLTKMYNGVKKVMDVVKSFATRIKTFFSNLKSGKGVVDSFKESFGDILDKLKELKENILDFFKNLFAKGDGISEKFNLDEIAAGIHEFVANITPDQIAMIAVAGSFMLIALNLLKLSNALRNAVEAFTGVGVALKNVINSYIKKQKSAILQVAEAIVIVAAAFWVLSTIPKDKMENAKVAMITIAGCLGALTLALLAVGAVLGNKGGPLALVQLASGLAVIAGSFLIMVGAMKALEFVNVSLDLITKIGIVTLVLGLMVGIAVILGKLDKFSKGSLTLIAVTASLFLAATALAELGQIPEGQLDNAMKAITKLMAGLGLLAFGASKLGVFSSIGLIAIILTFSKLMPAIENIVTYDYTKINEGLAQNQTMLKKLSGLLLIMTGIGALAGNRIKGAGIAFLSMAATFAILVGVAKLASMMRPSELAQGEAFIAHMSLLMMGLELCSRKSKLGMFGGKDSEGSKVFIRLAETMLILLGIAKLASMMDAKDILKGEGAIAGLALLTAGLVWVAKQARESKGVISSVAKMLVALSLILGMVAVLAIIPLDRMKPALAAVLSIMAAMAALAYAMSKNTVIYDKATQKSTSSFAFIMAAALMVVCGGILYSLSKQAPKNIAAAAGAIAAVAISVAALAGVIGRIEPKMANINWNQAASVGMAAAIIWWISEVLTTLSANMKNNGVGAKQMLAAGGAVAAVLLGLTPALYVIGHIGDKGVGKGQIMKVVEALGALAVIAVAIGALSRYGGDSSKMIASAIALSIVLLAVCAPISVLSSVGKFVSTKNKLDYAGRLIIGAMAVIAAAAVAVGALSRLGGDPKSMIAAAIALSTVLLAVCVPMAVLAAVGKFCAGAKVSTMMGVMAASVLALAGVAIVLGAFASLVDINKLIELNGAIPILITVMGGFAALAVALAFAGMVASIIPGSAAASFVIIGAVLTAFAGMITEVMILGAILNKFSGASKALDAGLDALVKIFGKLGEAVGTLINNFGMAATKDLDTIADRLNSFAEKMVPFSENMAKVSKDALDGCANLAGAMLCLTTAELMDGIAKFIGFGTPNFDFFVDLGKAVRAFSDEVSNISPEAINKASICSAIAKKLIEVNSTLDAQGGLAGAIFGEKDLNGFGRAIKQFGTGLKGFCESVEGIGEAEIASAQNAADATGPIITMTKSLNAQGGILQKIMGEKDLTKFGESITAYATSLTMFTAQLKILETTNPKYAESIQYCADATTPLLDLASKVQNSGGALGKIIGNNDLDIFGATLEPFARGLYRFVYDIKRLADFAPNYKQLIIDASDAASHLIGLTDNLKNVKAKAFGIKADNSLETFGESLKKFGKGIADFVEKIKDVDSAKVNPLVETVEKIVAVSKDASTITKDSGEGFSKIVKTLAKLPVSEMTTTLTDGKQTLSENMKAMLTAITTVVTNAIKTDRPTYESYGKASVDNLAFGMDNNNLTITNSSNKLITTMKDTLDAGMKQSFFETYGANVALGLAKGIEDNTSKAVEAARKMAEEVNKVVPEEFQEHSPSKLAYKFGKFYDMGLANGITDYTSTVVGSTSDMSQSIVETASNIISSIAKVIDSDIDSQPTIRPVLDTSDIENKAGRINSMFTSKDLVMAYNAYGNVQAMAMSKVANASGSNSSKKVSTGVTNNIYIDGIKYNDTDMVDGEIHNFVSKVVRKGRMYGNG